MRSLKWIVLIVVFLAAMLSAAVTVHVKNPWEGDATYKAGLGIVGNVTELGMTTYEGSAKQMKSEGAGWYSWTFSDPRQKNHTADMWVVVQNKKQNWVYKKFNIGSLKNLFNGSTSDQLDVWVTIDLSNNTKEVTRNPLDIDAATLIHVLNPWPENSPKITIDGIESQMLPNKDYTGWYTFVYMGERDPLAILLSDYFNSETYGQGGKNNSETIDLASLKDQGQEIFVWPAPKYDGPARIATSFPGIYGESNVLEITALVHDIKSEGNPAFEGGVKNASPLSSDKVTKNIAGEYLTDEGKIQKGSVDLFESADMPSWFETQYTPEGTTADTCITLELTKGLDGSWEYNSDLTNGFFPIDDFDPWNEGHYPTDPSLSAIAHNYSFTMEIRTEFKYHEGANQVFAFDGDDDVWVYINGKLAIDLGGPHPSASDSVNLDKIKDDFNLVDGQTYNLDMFYCERECWEDANEISSNFRMKTTIHLENKSSLFYNTSTNGNKTEVEIKKVQPKDNGFSNACGINVNSAEDLDTIDAQIVDFVLYGPEFGNESDTLKTGINYGGIEITVPNRFSIDLPAITGLKAGEYTLGFVDDGSFTGTYTFTVFGKAPLYIDTLSTDSKAALNDNVDTVIYKAQELIVQLATDPNCLVHYDIKKGTAQSSGSSPFDQKGELTLNGDTVTIEFWAIGNEQNSAILESDHRTVIFVQDRPNASIIATPSNGSNETYTFDVSKIPVVLSLVDGNGNDIEITDEVSLFYATENGDPTQGMEYNKGDTIWISKSDTLRAVATITGYDDPEEGIWYYIQDLKSASLTATPSDDNVYYFGRTLSVTLESNADTIRYSYQDDLSKSSSLYKSELFINENSNDTVTIYGLAYDDDLESTYRNWKYVRDTLPDLIADPSGTTFTGDLKISFSFDGEDNGWENVRIFYTLDGSDPDTNDFEADPYLWLDSSATVKARAFANNRIESSILTETYTLAASVDNAWYLDNSGNGAIDGAVLQFNKKLSAQPDEIILRSPFDSSETITVSADEIEINSDSNEITIVLNNEFSFLGSTGFSADNFGSISGVDFLEGTTFELSDSVAPVLVKADYYTGQITETDPQIIRDEDTLKLLYSEKVSIENMQKPIEFSRDGSKDVLTMKTKGSSLSGTEAVFVIESDNNYSVSRGDLVHINVDSKTSANGKTQEHYDNRWIELDVHEPPYKLIFRAISPVNPSEYEIPDELAPDHYVGKNGLVISADFMSKLWESDKIKAKASIFDMLGNEVAYTGKIAEGESLVAELHSEETTKILFYWDGKNKRGRLVARGAYIAVVTVVDPDGVEVQERIPLGIQ